MSMMGNIAVEGAIQELEGLIKKWEIEGKSPADILRDLKAQMESIKTACKAGMY